MLCNAAILEWFAVFHVWDFLYANCVEQGDQVRWRTEARFPLNPGEIFQRWNCTDQLIGVRFATTRGGTTQYVMLDIDWGSCYHPYSQETELNRLLGILESIGLCRFIGIQSSFSGGIHIYFPLSEPVLCSSVSYVIHHILKEYSFTIQNGTLEIFPNFRSSPRVNYNGHRLPLQHESYVLDHDWQPLHNSIERFISTWNCAALQQDMELLKQALESYPSRQRKLTNDCEEWRARLEATITVGWTDHQQTNRILQELCTYGRVFCGLAWDEVEKWVVKKAPTLPGYKEFCCHQEELHVRVRDWVKCNQNSKRYYPMSSNRNGLKTPKKTPKGLLNHERQRDAIQRIEDAIDKIKQQFGALPNSATDRKKLICKIAKCSLQTLYKYTNLWHPDFDC